MLVKKSKYKNIIVYGIFGVLTTLINIIVYKILVDKNIYYVLSNVIAFIISVIFAYITNKRWVFYSKVNTHSKVFKEFFKFLISRITTFLIDFLGVIFLVEVIYCGKTYSKIFVNIIVIILNYLFSKKIVFNSIEEWHVIGTLAILI